MITEELLSAAFITGISECMQATAEGLYVQAGALIRQEIETLAHIEKTSSEDYLKLLEGAISDSKPNRAFSQKVHNMKNLSVDALRKRYDELSKIAHNTHIDVLGNLFGKKIATPDGQSAKSFRYCSIFRADIAEVYLSTHMLSVIHFCKLKTDEILPLAENSEQSRILMISAVNHALSILEKRGFVKRNDQAVD